jgi:hypothetical protein
MFNKLQTLLIFCCSSNPHICTVLVFITRHEVAKATSMFLLPLQKVARFMDAPCELRDTKLTIGVLMEMYVNSHDLGAK